MVPDAVGDFVKIIDFSQYKQFPISYKYIVDGEWKLDTSFKSLSDENGFLNNYLDLSDLNYEMDPIKQDVPFADSTKNLAYASAELTVDDPKVDFQGDAGTLDFAYVFCSIIV